MSACRCACCASARPCQLQLTVPGPAAGNIFFWRRRGLRRKRKTDEYDDPYGPTVLGAVLLLALGAAFTSGLVKLASNDFVLAKYAALRR